ncbi:hypothetical protein F5887DRAFT_1021023 [Amanita rubescens]|nr:hypothetical protein F5887DRAFT_1021023 [Amanita rubescens]
MKIRFPEKITKIYENMLQNFKERINSRSLKLDLVEDGLGQTFEPYFEFGVVYWMKPKLLGSPPDASGSEADHPVIPIGKVNDPNNPGRDLFFLAQISGYLPLKDEYKATAGAYFESSSLTTHNSGRRLLKDEMDIGWAQVALDVSFCYGRQKGDGKHAHLKKDQMEKIRQNMQANYDKRVKSGSLKLDFNKDDLNQYDPAGFTSKGEGTTDFSVKLGYLYWMKTPQKDSKDITHFVVPVGKVPDEPEHYFIAEMTSRLPPWKSYWKSAIEYFSEKEFVVIGNRITPRNWLINTSWAVEMPKQLLYRCNGDGRGVQMNKDKIQELLNSMVTNYRERRKGGESDFSITNEPVGDEGGPAAGQRSGQNWRIPVSKKAIGESSKSKS